MKAVSTTEQRRAAAPQMPKSRLPMATAKPEKVEKKPMGDRFGAFFAAVP